MLPFSLSNFRNFIRAVISLPSQTIFGSTRRVAYPTPVADSFINQADSARDRKNFLSAAGLYCLALENDPLNAAIHIQCGHMNKEAGRVALAEKHYLAAQQLTPNDPDLHLQLGHFFKISDRIAEARASYQTAEQLLPGWRLPLAELAALNPAGLQPAVLMVDAFYPRPDSDSGSLDQIMYIKMFQELDYKVFFAADRELDLQSRYRDALAAMRVECVVHPEYNSIQAFLSSHAAELSLCFLSRGRFGAPYLDAVRSLCPRARVIFNPVDLHYVREQRQADLTNDIALRTKAEESRIIELRAVVQADATIVVSQYEAGLLRDAVPSAKVVMIPLIRDYVTGRRAPYQERAGISFIGSYYHLPNVDAVHYFLNEIWPLVRNVLPEVEFFVIGSNLPGELAARCDPGVTWVGHVPDLEPWLNRLRITVAPLRYGAGAKGKVVSSLAYGVPCVVSPIAAEGMELTDGVDVKIGQSPGQFAEHVISLYTNAEQWQTLSDAGVTTVNEFYSFKRGVDLLRDLAMRVVTKDS